MIKDSIDFDHAINKLTTMLEAKMQYQELYLDSNKMNTTFQEIESTLNGLYEKTRYLEDAIQYARVFLDTKIKDFNEEMDAVIKELEGTLNMSKNLAYLSYNVPLKQNDTYQNDRDANQDKLSPLILKDKVLTLGYEQDNDIPYSSVYTVNDSIAYDSTIDSVVDTKSYKAIFLEEKLLQNGLTETMVVYFKEPVTINVLDFVTSNCSIKNIRFGLINGIEENASDYNIEMNNVARTCIYVKFDMVCTNYNTVVYEIDKSKMSDNLWNDLKEYELAKVTNMDKIKKKIEAEYIISRTVTNKITGENTKEKFSTSANKQVGNLVMYSYIFGLDRLNFKYAKPYTTGCFISDYIHVGKMSSVEYLTLNVSHVQDDNCAIEYSILDGNNEIPILPVGIDTVENEPIFPGGQLRFQRNSDTQSSNYMNEIIKKDGQLVDVAFNDAINKNDGQYTITYNPKLDYHKAERILNESIRVKCYIRTFGTDINNVSYIDMITIRKYGEDALWINKY